MAEEQFQGLRPFLEVHQEVRRLFQELVYRPWGSQGMASPQSWQPRCDMVETDAAIIVEVELPGVTCEEVRLEVEGDLLRMTGERRAATERQGRNYHYLEQHYGRFERQLRLPRSVDRNAMHAECVNGILRITLPKTREQPTSSAQTRKDAP